MGLPQTRKNRGGRPSRAPLRIQNAQAGFSRAGIAAGPASVPARRPWAQMGARTQELRPIWAAACGCSQRLPFRSRRHTARESGPGKSERKAATDRKGPQDSGPASPSHGELDHGQSGARAAQLRLEIRVAPDRLHSHHSQRARKGGRDATGFETEGDVWERNGGGSGRPRPGHRAGRPRRLLRLSVPSHARERRGRGGGDRRGERR